MIPMPTNDEIIKKAKKLYKEYDIAHIEIKNPSLKSEVFKQSQLKR
jgi:hypothetical protein